MAYQILNNKSVITYLLSIPQLREFFATDRPQDFSCQEIGDGNLNLVFIVSTNHQPQKQLIVKQALPYIRCLGEEYLMAKERMHYEIDALKKFYQFSPVHTPKIYHTDKTMCLVVMQYLGQHLIMRKGMIKKNYYPEFANHISSFLAESLFKTSSFCLESIEKNQLISQFNSNELRKLTENFVFSFPFMSHPTNHVRPTLQNTAQALWADLAFKEQVLVLKDLFMNKTDALLHGDLHTGSIMINPYETYVIDPEFAFVGPFGFDVGALLGNLVMSWVSHLIYHQDQDYQTWILTVIKEFITQFENKFLALARQHSACPLIIDGYLSKTELESFLQKFMRNLFQESIGFAGCKMARRQLGVAGVEDIRGISDEVAVTKAEKLVLAIAREFVVNHRRYETIDDLLKTLHHYSHQQTQNVTQSN